MEKILVNRITKRALQDYLKHPGPPLLLTGREGSGKNYLAGKIISQVLGQETPKLQYSQSNVLVVEKLEKKQNISIEQIRSVQRFLKLKTIGQKPLRRAVLILDAQYMNEEAQNALLKTLEEPILDTLFVLTASGPNKLLPTVRSRCQILVVRPITLLQATEELGNKYPKKDLESAWRLSGGAVGLMLV